MYIIKTPTKMVISVHKVITYHFWMPLSIFIQFLDQLWKIESSGQLKNKKFTEDQTLKTENSCETHKVSVGGICCLDGQVNDNGICRDTCSPARLYILGLPFYNSNQCHNFSFSSCLQAKLTESKC